MMIFSYVPFKHFSWRKCAYCGKQINAGERVRCDDVAPVLDMVESYYFCDKDCARYWYKKLQDKEDDERDLNAYIMGDDK